MVGDVAKIANFVPMRSILIIRLSSLGDVVLATPLVRQLHRTYPRARIDVAVSSRFAGVWQNNPRVAHVWPILTTSATDATSDEIKLKILESLSGECGGQYDLIVDLQHNLRSAALRHGLGSTVVLAPKHRLEKLALVWLKKRPAKTQSIVSRYRKLLEHLPLVGDIEPCEVWLPEERRDGVYLNAQPARGALHRIAIAPGAQHATKRWPIAKYAQLVRELTVRGNKEIVLIGGPADVDICSAVAEASGVDVLRADGSLSVESTVRALDTCQAIITNDSGVMHLASARRLPIVAIFGSTVQEFGFAPYAVPFKIVEHNVSCRPCSHIGRASCPKGHFLCMVSIETEQVLSALAALI